jgi:hypothetical protein
MSVANPLWGTPRIHGELLKLGINVGQTAVAKYMAGRSKAMLRARVRALWGLSGWRGNERIGKL